MSTADNSHTEKLRRLRQTTQAIFRKRALAHGTVSGFYRSEEGPSGTVEESVHLSTKLGGNAYTVQKAEAGPENGLGVVTIPPCCDISQLGVCLARPETYTWVSEPVIGVYDAGSNTTRYTVITDIGPPNPLYNLAAYFAVGGGNNDTTFQYEFVDNDTLVIIDPLNRFINESKNIYFTCVITTGGDSVIDEMSLLIQSPPT
jgi:hypothetical protein